MNNDIVHRNEHGGKRMKQQILAQGEEQIKLFNEGKRLNDKVEELNTRAVICISTDKCQQALVYLEQAEQLLESAASKGFTTDRRIVQCILHNQATCFQNLWQLDQCSNYIEALIFNSNSLKGELYNHKQTVLGLSQYYLQFCAVNSQLGNHSGALISARKSLILMKGELKEWKRLLQINHKEKGIQNQQKIRLLNLVYRLNDNINISQLDIFQEAVGYYVKNWRGNASNGRNTNKDVKELIEGFAMKSIMALQRMNYEDCIKKHEKEGEMSLLQIYRRILMLSSCYFTIATELRLISLKKQRESDGEAEKPQYKQSQIYHLLSIVLLVFTVPFQFSFVNHLITNFYTHYNKNIEKNQFQFKKIYAQIVFIHQGKNRQTSIICYSEHEQGLGSHLSKGSATMIRITKGSKQSSKNNKFSLIDPKSKKSKLKHKKIKQGKNKKESKSKHPRQSQSKSNFKSNSKESIIIKSQKSKDSLQPKSSIPSIKLIINNKSKQSNPNITQKAVSKRKTKVQPNTNEYFLMKKGEQRKVKKLSVSVKKNSSKVGSAGRLPIDSTLQTKQNNTKQKKKSSKKSILQHYM